MSFTHCEVWADPPGRCDLRGPTDQRPYRLQFLFSEKRERKTQERSIILSLGEAHDEAGFKCQAVSEGVS